MTIAPAPIGSSPAIARRIVVFPAPDAPISATTSPRDAENEMPETIARAPRRTSSDCTSSTVMSGRHPRSMRRATRASGSDSAR